MKTVDLVRNTCPNLEYCSMQAKIPDISYFCDFLASYPDMEALSLEHADLGIMRYCRLNGNYSITIGIRGDSEKPQTAMLSAFAKVVNLKTIKIRSHINAEVLKLIALNNPCLRYLSV